jgi:hypothetical protein
MLLTLKKERRQLGSCRASFWGFKEKRSPFQGSSPPFKQAREKGGRVIINTHVWYYVVLTYYSVPALLPQAKKSWVGRYIYYIIIKRILYRQLCLGQLPITR